MLCMPLARLAQCEHCLLRRNGVRTVWTSSQELVQEVAFEMRTLRLSWLVKDGVELEKSGISGCIDGMCCVPEGGNKTFL